MLLQDKNNWLKSAFIYFIIAAILGVFLRFAFVIEMPLWFKYKNIQHAHSHAAMMGWLSAGFYIFICHYFKLERKAYQTVFWLSQASVLGMLLSFPVQGYGFFSILFSSAYLILSYVFIFLVLKDIRTRAAQSLSVSTRFLKASMWFMGISSLGIWAMAVIMAKSLQGTAWYYASVQFFLHFQFNGWFVFALLALFFKVLEKQNVSFPTLAVQRFYWLLLVSCFLTYALSVTWSTPKQALFWVNSIGVLLQVTALFYFLTLLKLAAAEARKQFSKLHFSLWGIAFFCLSFKILIQTLVAIPYLATVSYTIRNFVIGFIHLLMLGALSTFIFGLMDYMKFRLSKTGLNVFLAGFVLSELFLFGQGVLLWAGQGFIPQYYLLLALSSTLLPVGVILLFPVLKDRKKIN